MEYPEIGKRARDMGLPHIPVDTPISFGMVLMIELELSNPSPALKESLALHEITELILGFLIAMTLIPFALLSLRIGNDCP